MKVSQQRSQVKYRVHSDRLKEQLLRPFLAGYINSSWCDPTRAGKWNHTWMWAFSKYEWNHYQGPESGQGPRFPRPATLCIKIEGMARRVGVSQRVAAHCCPAVFPDRVPPEPALVRPPRCSAFKCYFFLFIVTDDLGLSFFSVLFCCCCHGYCKSGAIRHLRQW